MGEREQLGSHVDVQPAQLLGHDTSAAFDDDDDDKHDDEVVLSEPVTSPRKNWWIENLRIGKAGQGARCE